VLAPLALALLLLVPPAGAGGDGPGACAEGGAGGCSAAAAGGSVYVSFVMVGRVDTLRGDYVNRLRNSVQFIQALSMAHSVRSEVVIVEWNPLAGMDSLAEVLRPYVGERHPSQVRIITVPKSFHDKVSGDTGQSFFEFMAKNVGARRARGEFVLITNGDVMLNDPVYRMLGAEALDADSYFRIPRVDTSAHLNPEREPLDRRLGEMRGMVQSLPAEQLCDVGERFCPGRYNAGVCERGYLGEELHDEHFGRSDGLFMPAAGDFFLVQRHLYGVLGGYHQVPSTTHLDSLLLCKASGLGLRQIVLTRPCVMFHQKHPARDLGGNEVSDACVDGKMGDQDCVNRFLLQGWELSEDNCLQVESDAAHVLSQHGLASAADAHAANVSLDHAWGFPAEDFVEVVL